MRYFLLILVLLGVSVLAIAGKRGSMSRRPPMEVFPDMDRQPKQRPQYPNPFFADGMGSRLPVDGTVSRGQPFAGDAVNTGKTPGTTNWVNAIPIPVTAQLMARGQERFTIYCAPCHGATGEGKGITTKLGMAVIADLHDMTGRKVVQQPDGQLFNTITHGLNLMGPYGGVLTPTDRWAVIAYVRALQRSRLATLDDVPQEMRVELTRQLVPAPAGDTKATNAAPAGEAKATNAAPAQATPAPTK